MSRRPTAFMAFLVGTAMLSACGDGGLLPRGGDGAPVDIQVAHPSGVVLQVLAVRVASERTAVDLLVMNGRDREIRLNQGNETSYILTDGGAKLMLAPPVTNTNLAVPGTRSADMTLVFEGELPTTGNATLVLNERGSTDATSTNTPRFQVSFAVDGASGSVAESAMANLRAVPSTVLRSAGPQGSPLGAAAGGGSNLQVVEALKSELGAVDTERGTVVSLPGDVTFDFDEASLRANALPTLDQLSELIGQGGDGAISIEGHTDSRGDDSYNQRLSLARAESVKAYLVEQGVPENRLRTLGLGETRPVAPNANADGSDDETGRQRNRRVEVILPNTRGDTRTE